MCEFGTMEYFEHECRRFQERLCSKEEWIKPDRIIDCWGALLYLATRTKGDEEKISLLLSWCQTEFDMRHGLHYLCT